MMNLGFSSASARSNQAVMAFSICRFSLSLLETSERASKRMVATYEHE